MNIESRTPELRRVAIRNSWNQKCFNKAFNDFTSSDDSETLVPKLSSFEAGASDEDILKDILSTPVEPRCIIADDKKCCSIL